jgi:hypothetical protein
MKLTMKKRIPLLTLTASAALLLSAAVQAASHQKIEFIDQYDNDSDGKVSSAEFEQARRKRFDATDSNKNGTVDPEEYVYEWENRLDTQLAVDRKEQVKQTATRFKSLDDDKNQQISLNEYNASGNASWQRFDSNHDSILSSSDNDPLHAETTKQDSERSREQILHDTKRILNLPSTHSMQGTVEQYDSDGDKVVTQAEFAQGRSSNFARSDRNNDSWLSEDEYTVEFEDRLDQHLASTRKQSVEQALVRFGALDANENKQMTFAEYQQSGHRSFGRFDTDGSGFVTLEEADTAEPEFTPEQQQREQQSQQRQRSNQNS